MHFLLPRKMVFRDLALLTSGIMGVCVCMCIRTAILGSGDEEDLSAMSHRVNAFIHTRSITDTSLDLRLVISDLCI